MPKISVVIPTLNEEKYLKNCLESLKKQTFSDFEIIISDGGSTDNTVKIAKQYTSNIIVHKNSNVCQARDLGAREAHAEIIVGADADTIYPKDHLEIIWHHFQNHPQVVAVVGGGKVNDGPRLSKIYWRMTYFLVEKIYQMTRFTLYAPAYDISFQKDIFLKIGGYDINLDFGGDELDFLARIRKTGKVIFDPHLCPSTSGRRFKVGFFVFLIKHALYYYWFSYILGKLFGKTPIRAKPVR